MLRMILGVKRKVLVKDEKIASCGSCSSSGEEIDCSQTDEEAEMEAWPEFLKRATGLVEDKLAGAGEEEWLTTWRRRQWRWAGGLVRHNQHKWSYAALKWNPLLHTRSVVTRKQARPRKRWADDLVNFSDGGDWMTKAQDATAWTSLEEQWIAWCNQDTGPGQARPSS